MSTETRETQTTGSEIVSAWFKTLPLGNVRAVHCNQLADAIDKALRDERGRAAKIADERAAFNHRQMKMYQIGDPMADLKSTRADEAERIAKEIRSDPDETEAGLARHAREVAAAIRRNEGSETDAGK